jgi:putative sporulation protein YyaC
MLMSIKTEQSYINVNSSHAFRQFTDAFCEILKDTMSEHDAIVILCIGTDRSTGDSFGPLVGYKLSRISYENVHVYGTLDNPVHAKNLEENIANIYVSHKNPLIIAIDACLGRMDHVGYVTVAKGSIKPGTGVNKELPEVGDIAITGIVNFSGFLEFMVLQNTRLSIVMKMADTIALGIRLGIWKCTQPKEDVVKAIG